MATDAHTKKNNSLDNFVCTFTFKNEWAQHTIEYICEEEERDKKNSAMYIFGCGIPAMLAFSSREYDYQFQTFRFF